MLNMLSGIELGLTYLYIWNLSKFKVQLAKASHTFLQVYESTLLLNTEQRKSGK